MGHRVIGSETLDPVATLMYNKCHYDLVFQLEDRDSLYDGFGIGDTDEKGENGVLRRSMG